MRVKYPRTQGAIGMWYPLQVRYGATCTLDMLLLQKNRN